MNSGWNVDRNRSVEMKAHVYVFWINPLTVPRAPFNVHKSVSKLDVCVDRSVGVRCTVDALDGR